ncbi:hypothetical protein T440DRAFT_501592 [Plenodomus tracheiphilus IPT5]|uniref:Homeobox domain-containing protein n=1 Tax=Plenodomus tracheiphilus IPT5 TaxID=1408161 RepID=A0A6A7AVA8_9PLEO|nr:hypothetical protein T440DRAFT_501592 [Plenodomus tracheiphilus IPT5]
MENTGNMSQQDLESLFAFQNDALIADHAQHPGEFANFSNALAAMQTSTSNHDELWSLESPFRDFSNHSTAVSSPLTPGTPITRPKLGSRFSREVIRTLKNWLAVHQQHPYPNEDEMNALQERTGLNKAQLTNWFANARRRGKVQGIRPASPQVNIQTNPMDIIKRPGTPAFRSDAHYKDPLQRWVDSPPEHEPATARDIARAMASSSRRASQETAGPSSRYTDPWQSPYARSSASSAATSQSSGEFSAHRSSGSQSSLKMRRPPRRKRASRRRHIEQHPVAEPLMPYQCTFCTEVFKTKYDWQRHEKSLHLPLEKWICALHGPRGPKKDVPEACCVFCGEAAPDDAHLEAHHYSACQERSLEERTFHRKDHLVQHLRLVHGAKFAQWSMAHWMLPMPDIRSRCGFCSIIMNTWEERTDHLADHFKAGATMANWHGDWGFDQATSDMVESAIPPYFVDYERTTLIPMKASDPPWGSPPNAYELIKVEIEFFIQNYFDKTQQLPTNDAMQLEACRIIFAGEASANVQLNTTEMAYSPSWLRDLIMSAPELTRQARFGPIRISSESRHSPLKINGKDHLFEMCPLETQLRAYVLSQQALDAPTDDSHLQSEACAIVRRMEGQSGTPSDMFANWIVKGIYSGTDWLTGFKQRASVTSTTHTLGLMQEPQPNVGLDWNNTQLDQSNIPSYHAIPTDTISYASMFASIPDQPSPFSLEEPTNPSMPTPPNVFDIYGRLRTLLPDDTNFYRIFDSDMKRWAAATMSPKNPNCHVPSDEEIQHQARWIMYDGDDTWNQTPADYEAWLQQFKRGVGIETGGGGVGVVDPKALSKD